MFYRMKTIQINPLTEGTADVYVNLADAMYISIIANSTDQEEVGKPGGYNVFAAYRQSEAEGEDYRPFFYGTLEECQNELKRVMGYLSTVPERNVTEK